MTKPENRTRAEETRRMGLVLAERIRARRLELGLTRPAAAARAGTSRQAWALWESGTVPSALWLLAIARAVETDAATLIEDLEKSS